MPAGKQSSKDVTITYDDSAGAPQAMTGFIMEIGGTEIEMELESSEAFGDFWREKVGTGMWTSPPITFKGHFDTSALGPHAVMRPVAADALPNATPRSLVVAYGDGKTFSVETRPNKYRVSANNGKLTSFEMTATPTGEAVWAP